MMMVIMQVTMSVMVSVMVSEMVDVVVNVIHRTLVSFGIFLNDPTLSLALNKSWRCIVSVDFHAVKMLKRPFLNAARNNFGWLISHYFEFKRGQQPENKLALDVGVVKGHDFEFDKRDEFEWDCHWKKRLKDKSRNRTGNGSR